MNSSTLRKSILAAALGAGLTAAQIVGAQTSPGEERQPAGPPNAGDTRTIPGPDPKQGPASRPSDERPLLRQPSERSTNPGDPRATPGGDSRAPRTATTRKDRVGADAERQPDGPDAGIAKSGVKP